MSALPDLQAAFAAALLGGDAVPMPDDIVADGLAPAARLQIYRHHVLTSLTEALRATYGVVNRLVGAGFFAYAADAYVRAEPPAGPCLAEYGASFPAFLSRFPACAGHPYLGDVARLEWALNVALVAPDVAAVAPAALAAVAPGAEERVVLALDPAASWLRSPWPIDRIWHANQAGVDPGNAVRLDAGGVALEVRRSGARAVFRAIGPPVHAFRASIGGGAPLLAAAEAALAEDPGFDLAFAVRALFEDALVVGVALAPPERDPRTE
jgi:Putative DNA-binding domain